MTAKLWFPCDSNAVPLVDGVYPTRRANGMLGYSLFFMGVWRAQRMRKGPAASALPPHGKDAHLDRGKEWSPERVKIMYCEI